MEKLTKAIILAAGFGSRLRPLTDETPKALLKINGKPLLEIIINKLIGSGINEIIVNVHHHKEKIINYISGNDFGKKITLSVENEILGTGGGIKNTALFFSDCNSFLVYNVDIISELDINQLFEFHLRYRPMASLATQRRDTTRPLIFDSDDSLVGRVQNNAEKIYKKPTGDTYLAGFCGVHIISTDIFKNFHESGTFDIFTAYFRLVSGKNKILGYDIKDSPWCDVGTIETFKRFTDC